MSQATNNSPAPAAAHPAKPGKAKMGNNSPPPLQIFRPFDLRRPRPSSPLLSGTYSTNPVGLALRPAGFNVICRLKVTISSQSRLNIPTKSPDKSWTKASQPVTPKHKTVLGSADPRTEGYPTISFKFCHWKQIERTPDALVTNTTPGMASNSESVRGCQKFISDV